MNRAFRHSALLTIAGILMAASFPGCESAPVAKPAPPPPAPTFAVPDAPVTATSQLVTHTQQFDSEVAQLPGGSAEAHRVIALSLLDELPRVLQLANGNNESPEFQNRLSVIKAAAATIREPDVDRRRMEAVENQALQAAAPALADIVEKLLYDDDQLPPLLATLNDKVQVAAGSVGPIHDMDATNAFTAMDAVVDRITNGLAAKFLPGAP